MISYKTKKLRAIVLGVVAGALTIFFWNTHTRTSTVSRELPFESSYILDVKDNGRQYISVPTDHEDDKDGCIPTFKQHARDFVHLSNSVKHDLGFIPKITAEYGMFNPVTTRVTLVSPMKDNVCKGDILHYRIESMDENSNLRVEGGDFLLAKITGVDTASRLNASTAGYIEDYHNGTYSVYFYAGWVGSGEVSITLAHPREAILWMNTHFRSLENLTKWEGVFISNDNQKRESTTCRLVRTTVGWKQCIYLNPDAYGDYHVACEPPPSLPCYTLTDIRGSLVDYQRYLHDILMKTNFRKLPLFNSPYLYEKLHISDGLVKIKDREQRKCHLPTCSANLPPSLSGYWIGDTWHNTICEPKFTNNLNDIGSCMRNKNLILCGDSTTRQWFAKIKDLLGSPKLKGEERFGYARLEEKDLNFNMTFHFHHLKTGPLMSKISDAKFESQILYDLTDENCKDTIVVLSPWSHFILWPWNAFEDKVEAIKNAIIYAQGKCHGELPIVLKSPHPVNWERKVYGRDSLFMDIMKVFRKEMTNLGVIFVDIWDITYSSFSPLDIHMPSQVIDAEIQVLLSYVCERNDFS